MHHHFKPRKHILYGRKEPLIGHKICIWGVATFPQSGNPIPDFFRNEVRASFRYPSVLISYITFTRIQTDLCVSGTHLKRRVPKNNANPRYKCVEIFDMDPIGDQSHNEENPQFWSHPSPLIPLFPHLGAGGKTHMGTSKPPKTVPNRSTN